MQLIHLYESPSALKWYLVSQYVSTTLIEYKHFCLLMLENKIAGSLLYAHIFFQFLLCFRQMIFQEPHCD